MLVLRYCKSSNNQRVQFMANPKQLKILLQGVEEWNRWRGHHPKSKIDLKAAVLSTLDLRHANLSHVDLSYSDLKHTELSYANLSESNLSFADLSESSLHAAELYGAT